VPKDDPLPVNRQTLDQDRSLPRIATITLNATLDHVLLVPGLEFGMSHDAVRDLTLPGGKGLNAARAAHQIGCQLMTTGILAGSCGQWIFSLLEQIGIPQRFYRVQQGESRTSTILIDPTRGKTTVVHDAGPKVTPSRWPAISQHIIEAVKGFPWIALCGSCPTGIPSDAYAVLIRELQKSHYRVCLDTRDQWLTLAAQERPYLVKCNHQEAAAALQRSIETPEQAYKAAQAWVEIGIEHIVITLGDRGAVAIEGERAWHITAPRVEPLSAIGSGDALMAGVISALARGESLPAATRYGVALGAANAIQLGSACLDLQALSQLAQKTTIGILSKAEC
jgi:tagatose 6-phosphate kinase